jgi:hypothetical protein
MSEMPLLRGAPSRLLTCEPTLSLLHSHSTVTPCGRVVRYRAREALMVYWFLSMWWWCLAFHCGLVGCESKFTPTSDGEGSRKQPAWRV